MARPIEAVIDLNALRHNYRLAASLASASQTMAVVKANAYGHGAVMCAKALESFVPAFGVASIEEAVELRDAGIEKPILLLEGVFDASELALCDSLDLWQVVHSLWQVEAILAYSPRKPFNVWLKLDSGMHRLGFSADAFKQQWQRLQATDTVNCEHLISHFSSADQNDASYYDLQQALINQLCKELGAKASVANSPSVLSKPLAHADWNRPGIMLYGSNPLAADFSAQTQVAELRPVMTLCSKIISINQVEAGEPVGYGGRWRASASTRIGVIAAGYGDGYDRHAIDGTPILVDGIRCELAGRVSMDMITVDLTNAPDAHVGSHVTLWGDGLSVDEVASYCSAIGYTLLTGLLPRVPKRYLPVQANI